MLTPSSPLNPHAISLQLAAEMTLRYRQNRTTVVAPTLAGQDVLPLSETFSAIAVQGLLSNPACTAIRIYYGMDVSLKVHAILVGVNINNEDILPPATDEEEDGKILEDSLRCPPVCPPPSPLNEP